MFSAEPTLSAGHCRACKRNAEGASPDRHCARGLDRRHDPPVRNISSIGSTKRICLSTFYEKSPCRVGVCIHENKARCGPPAAGSSSKDGIKTASIHGRQIARGSRQAALKNFKDHRVRVLYAATRHCGARNRHLRASACNKLRIFLRKRETDVHRIGRNGTRRNARSCDLLFCSYEEKLLLSDVEWLTGDLLCELTDNPYPMRNITPEKKDFVPSTYKSIGKKPRRGSRRR